MATSVQLDLETEQRLDVLAAQTGRTKASYLREIIELDLEDLEDYYQAAGVLKRMRKGQEQVHGAADVRKEIDVISTAHTDALMKVPAHGAERAQ